MVLFVTVVAVGLLWLADRWGLGQGGELLFAVCLVGGGVWLADTYFGFLGVLIFLVAAGSYLKYRKYRAQERARAELRREMSWQN
jgi:hypothetical protein